MAGERAQFDDAKVRILALWNAKPRDLYALGEAARPSVEAPTLAQALGYADGRAMVAAELPEIPADLLLHAAAVAAECSPAEFEKYGFDRMWLVTRWVREAGFVRPAGGLEAWQVHTVDEDGQPAATKLFARCSPAELERALEVAKRSKPDGAGKAPAPPAPAPQPPVQEKTWPYWRVLGIAAALAVTIWVLVHRSGEPVPAPEPEPASQWVPPMMTDAGRVVLEPMPRLRPTHPTIRSASPNEPPLESPTPIAAPAPKPDVGPDLTPEQLEEILRHAGPVTHPVE